MILLLILLNYYYIRKEYTLMARIMLPITEVEDMVTRPVVLDITRQLVDITHFRDRATGEMTSEIQILFPGAEERVALNGSTINKDKDVANFNHGNQISLEISEEIETDAVLTRAVMKPEHLPCIFDSWLGILIKPVYTHTFVNMEFTQRFQDKATAERWLNEMRNKIAMSRDTILHTATYSYSIPLPMLTILKEIHRLRENVAGYGDSWEEYMAQATTPNVTVITNVGGKTARWGVKETQQRIIGMFDFNAEPEKGSRTAEGDTWTVSFTYRFEYDKPAAMVMEYPLVVHNQLLDEKYRPVYKDNRPMQQLTDVEQLYPVTGKYFSFFESDRDYDKYLNTQMGIAIPEYDDFFPAFVPAYTWRLVTYLVGITEEDKRTLVNLKELPGVGDFDPVLHEFLLKEAPWVHVPTESVFNIQLYQAEDRLRHTLFRVNTNYDVVATTMLDLRQVYHVRLGIYNDWTKLSDNAKRRLRENPDVIKKLIDGLFPDKKPEWYDRFIKEQENDDGTKRKKPVSREDFDKIADELNGTKVDNTKKICVTVQTLWFNVLRTKPDEVLEKATTHSFNY